MNMCDGKIGARRRAQGFFAIIEVAVAKKSNWSALQSKKTPYLVF